MRIHNSIVCLLSISSIYADNSVEKNIYKVRSSYLAEHVSTMSFKPTDWYIGKLDVPAVTYKQNDQEIVIGYSINTNGKSHSGNVKINRNYITSYPSEWMRNPIYTSEFNDLASVAINNDSVEIGTVNGIPDKSITSADLSKIQEYPNGYKALDDNLNASISDKYGEAMVGWLGIRREKSLSGVVIYSLLRQTHKSFRSSAVALLVADKSEIKHEDLKLLISLAFKDVNDTTFAEEIATGIMATSYCSPWQNNRLCDIAKSHVVLELKTSKHSGSVLDYIKLANKIE